MDLSQAIILGIIQGLTEFLPVSSSGHLILIPYLFHWGEAVNKVTFDVALHLGTAFAVILYFWRDWWELITSITRPTGQKAKLLYIIIIGSLPAALIGLLLDKIIEEKVRSVYFVIANLIIFGLVLLITDRRKHNNREIKDLTVKDSLLVGLAQSVALIPGVSRSGITISMALFRGLTREEATKFSFLLSTPVILGAGALKSLDFFNGKIPSSDYSLFIVGFLVSALVGFLAIKFLINYVRSHSFIVFVIYRFILAAALLGLVFLSY